MDPDPTPFFSDFKDAKKLIFHIFSNNLPAGTLSSVLAKVDSGIGLPNAHGICAVVDIR